jgi:predicted phage-related endonuclease
VSAQYPFAIASLDFIVCGVRENGLRPPVTYETLPPVGALEVKNASVYVAKEWGEENNNEPPLQYQIQLQHQLMVTGLAWGSIAALVGGSHFIWADRARDEQLINIIAEKEAEFWQRVIDRRPPEADGAEATREILRQIYPKDTGESIALDAEAIEWHEALVAAKGQKKVAEFDIDTYSNKLRQAIGDATVATLPNGVVYTHKWQDRAAYSVEAGGSRILRASAAKKGR